jgi:malonyl-CoA/methylmalonyl-CoA synthetase
MSAASITALFERTFATERRRIGLEWHGHQFTFADLDARANRMARALAARGVRSGDRIAVYLPNRVETIDLFLACTRSGVIYVPINILYREREIEHILQDASPAAVVTEGTLPAAPTVPTWSVEDLARDADSRSADRLPGTPPDGSAPAAIVYTSGTTGAAKGAVLTQRNFAANARRLLDAWHITEADRMLLPLPLFHVHGLGNGLHCWLAAGLRMRLLERFDSAATPLQMPEFGATLFFGVPTMYVRLLEVDEALAQQIGRTIRLFVSGSAPLPSQVLEAFRERFGHTILERYGMTETFMTLSNPYAGERRGGTVGVPLPGVRVRLVNDAGADVPDEVTGELLVKSDSLFAGYFNRPDATAAAFANEWFRTGDLATRSGDGYFTLQGRRSDVIISGGFNIYPREIEELLEEQDGIAEAAVVGVPDRVRGEVPVAYVVATPAGTPLEVDKLESVCRAKLASFKVPRRFVPLDRLPRTALGKVQKHLLSALNPEG